MRCKNLKKKTKKKKITKITDVIGFLRNTYAKIGMSKHQHRRLTSATVAISNFKSHAHN
jgi:rRNA processing protein Gar1